MKYQIVYAPGSLQGLSQEAATDILQAMARHHVRAAIRVASPGVPQAPRVVPAAKPLPVPPRVVHKSTPARSAVVSARSIPVGSRIFVPVPEGRTPASFRCSILHAAREEHTLRISTRVNESARLIEIHRSN